MGKYFGTDGIRGKYGTEITAKLAFKVGNALGNTLKTAKIVIGQDTRKTGELITLAFSCGVMSAGGTVTNVGICPTAEISYLTKKLNFDYGVVISASHNPAIYNGIKIFNSSGKKVCDDFENLLESKFNNQTFADFENVGSYKIDENLKDEYINFLSKTFDFTLTSKKIVLDMSNGASFFIAKKLFEEKGATVISIGDEPNGININLNVGATNIDAVKNAVLKNNADYGYAYDGDSDRVVAIDSLGNVYDGDKLIYILACYFNDIGKLKPKKVVGTILSNMGLELALEKKGITMIRTGVGDKNVSTNLEKCNLLIGGEPAGHIIVFDLLPTGDGVLNSLLISFVMEYYGKQLSEFVDFEVFEQVSINVEVQDKGKVLGDEKLKRYINNFQRGLENFGRVVVRASGTEPCIRVMVETKNKIVSENVASKLATIIKEIDSL